MRIIHLALVALVGGALVVVGCGGDGGGGAAGAGGTGATGGAGGTGGAPDDPCVGQPACIVCTQAVLPPDIAPFLPDGLRAPVDFTATPDGDVVQGETVSIEIAAEVVVALPLPAEGDILEGSTSTYVATIGGDGTLDIVIPEQMLAGQNLVIDGGNGSAEINVDSDATELVIGLDSILVYLSVTKPAELELTLDASANGDCSIEGEGVIVPVDAAP